VVGGGGKEKLAEAETGKGEGIPKERAGTKFRRKKRKGRVRANARERGTLSPSSHLKEAKAMPTATSRKKERGKVKGF